MRNLLLVLLVLLLFALVIGLFASSGNLLLENVPETTASNEPPTVICSKTQPDEDATLLCSYDHGISDPSAGAASGFVSNEEDKYTMIGVSFKNLTPGKTYTLFYDIDMSFIQYLKPSVYYLRTGGLSSYQFAEVPIAADNAPYGEGYVTFVAETSTVELFVVRLGLLTDSSMIDSYHLDFVENSCFKLYAESRSFIDIPGAQGVLGLQGPKGDKGDKGDPGYTPVKGVDYFDGTNGKDGVDGKDYVLTAADKAEIAELVDGATIVQAPKYVNSVSEMTDTDRVYVLNSTGHIFAYMNTTTEQEVTVREDIVATANNGYTDQARFTSSNTTDDFTTGSSQNGYHVTPMIDLTKYVGKTIQIHLEGAQYATTGSDQWIMCRCYAPNKTILSPRVYTSSDPLNSNGIMNNSFRGFTVQYNSPTSATITIAVYPTVSISGSVKDIGYIRFNGKHKDNGLNGVYTDSKIYITYPGTETVTGGQWVDTGTKYGSFETNIDENTLEKISALNNEGKDPERIVLLPSPVLDFYNADDYPDNDYSATYFSKITYSGRADIPVPYLVKWNYNEDAMRTIVAVDTNPIQTVNAYTLLTYEVTGLNNYPIYNLIPNTRYYYKVTHTMADGSLIEAKSGNFITSDETWRLIYIDGTQNVRDLGGWSGLNGKRVKYGKIFRGASLSDSSFPELIVTGEGRRSLGELKVTAELNLGADDTETSIASNCAYFKVGYRNYVTAITDATARANFKLILEKIVSWLSESNPRNIYMHCQGGCDRTGTLSFLLLGLLGVSESDLAKEYELSSFSPIGQGRRRDSTTYDYKGMVEAIKAYNGSTFTNNFEAFATDCGVTMETINAFRSLMLE